jgi:hypothetical protein
MRPLSARAFNQRRDDLYARLNRLGRVILDDRGGAEEIRNLEIKVFIPGQEGFLSFPDEVFLHYQEWWQQSSLGWILVRYDYDFFHLIDNSRRGYHLHQLGGIEIIPHLHCVPPGAIDDDDTHYEYYEVDLFEAHEEFERYYTEGTKLNCRGLRKIF